MRCVPIKHALLSLSLFRACESLHFKIGLGCGLFFVVFFPNANDAADAEKLGESRHKFEI